MGVSVGGARWIIMKKIKFKTIIIVLLTVAVAMSNFCFSGCASTDGGTEHLVKPTPEYPVYVEDEFGGVLNTAYTRVSDAIATIGNEYYVAGYQADNTNLWNAEPEFAGKYMYICSRLGGKYLDLAKDVVQSAIAAQRDDGYLGCLPKGSELVNFSVWNETFTVLGLLEYYNVTKDKSALDCAVDCASHVMSSLIGSVANGGRITDALNGGSQHISFFLVLARLYKATGNADYLDFAGFLIERCAAEGFDLIGFNGFLDQPSQKGIEMLVVYIGLTELADVLAADNTVDIGYSAQTIYSAVYKYWQEIADTQIRNTGGATSGEWWRQYGNAPAQLATSQAVNENCVSVGWVEFTAALLKNNTRAEYLDAMEKTIFNAVLGSMSTDGGDFAYYQGNFGKKEFATSGGMYKCCRTRGFSLIAELPYLMYKYADDEIVPVLFCENSIKLQDGLIITCETDYPRNGRLVYTVTNETGKNKKLMLRIPEWCKSAKCTSDCGYNFSRGFIIVDICGGTTVTTVDFDMEFVATQHNIGGVPHFDFTYGPLLLVHDRSNGTSLKESCYDPSTAAVKKDTSVWNDWDVNKPGGWYLTQFECGNLNLVDYASAGRANPVRDLFKTYIKGASGGGSVNVAVTPANPVFTDGPTATGLYLTDVTPFSIENGYCPYTYNKSCLLGTRLLCNGFPVEKGISVHPGANAEAALTYDISKYDYDTFTASVGKSDQKGNCFVQFLVYVDDVLKYDSGKIKSDACDFVSVDIKGAKKLRLVVNNGGDGHSFDECCWAYPMLIKDADLKPVSIVAENIDFIVEQNGRVFGADFTAVVKYNTGAFERVSGSKIVHAEPDTSKVGKQTISLAYGNCTSEFDITVLPSGGFIKLCDAPTAGFFSHFKRYANGLDCDDGTRFALAGRNYANGIGLHPTADRTAYISFDIDAENDYKLHAVLGKTRCSIANECVFYVYGDGKMLWRSDYMYSGETVTVDIDVSGVENLKIEVDCGDDGIAYDCAGIADAFLYRRDASALSFSQYAE